MKKSPSINQQKETKDQANLLNIFRQITILQLNQPKKENQFLKVPKTPAFLTNCTQTTQKNKKNKKDFLCKQSKNTNVKIQTSHPHLEKRLLLEFSGQFNNQ